MGDEFCDEGFFNEGLSGEGLFGGGSFGTGSFGVGSFCEGSFGEGSFGAGSLCEGSFGEGSLGEGLFGEGSLDEGSDGSATGAGGWGFEPCPSMPAVALGALAVGLERGAGGGVREGARCLAGVSTVGGSWNPRAASYMHAYQRFWTAKAPLLGCRGRPTVHVLNAGSISNNCVGATMNGLQGFAKCGPTSTTVDVVVQLARSAGLKSPDEACCPATPRFPIYPAYVYK